MFFKKKNNFSEDNLDSVIKACLNQDSQAQKTLIRLFYGYAKSISMRYAAHQEEAEEIINDSFLKIFIHIKNYDHSIPFKGWLRTIVINTSIDHYRKNKKYKHFSSSSSSSFSFCLFFYTSIITLIDQKHQHFICHLRRIKWWIAMSSV